MQKAIIGAVCCLGLGFAALFGLVGGYALIKLEGVLTSQTTASRESRERGELMENPWSGSRVDPERRITGRMSEDDESREVRRGESVSRGPSRVVRRAGFEGRKTSRIQRVVARDDQEADESVEGEEPAASEGEGEEYVRPVTPAVPGFRAASSTSRTKVMPVPVLSAARVAALAEAPAPAGGPGGTVPGPTVPGGTGENNSGTAAKAPEPVSVKTVTVEMTSLVMPSPISGQDPVTFTNFTSPVLLKSGTNLTLSGKLRGDAGILKSEKNILILYDDVGLRHEVARTATFSGDDKSGWTVLFTAIPDGDRELFASLKGETDFSPAARISVSVRTKPPVVLSALPVNVASSGGMITLTFDEELDPDSVSSSVFEFRRNKTTTDLDLSASPDGRSVHLRVGSLEVGEYTLRVKKEIKDLYGNSIALEKDGSTYSKYSFSLFWPVGGDAPLIAPGIRGATGPYVAFPEFTPPRPEANGFNPSDKVVTRTVRLYYFRDAHRVAQIVNRNVRSYNRAAVDVAEQLADRARTTADQTTMKRQTLERAAIHSAEKTRRSEKQLRDAQQKLSTDRNRKFAVNAQKQAMEGQIGTLRQQLPAADQAKDASQLTTDLAGFQEELRKLQAPAAAPMTPQDRTAKDVLNDIKTRQALIDLLNKKSRLEAAEGGIDGDIKTLQDSINGLQQDIQIKREEEFATNDQAQVADADESLARQEQFRREVAVGHADPDTYVPGRIDSVDPVEQVSISVIGEGVIQLRGPIKGVNVIRTMINEIDAPVGQVRVAIHTMQVNGEHGDRMERVVGGIRHYVDHARFLSTQSAEMLRKAVVKVASLKAMSVMAECPNDSQEFRDQKYIAAFFGQDFLDELCDMDSEFLKTGNKLLSLHSMDTTSLSSALFLLALAKNSTREEIMMEFGAMTEGPLQEMEQEYIVASGDTRKISKKFVCLAPNARFASIKGFFDAEVAGDDTLNPAQREFIRLAQIFKSRMITEIELASRVTERSIIEERLGNYLQELRDAKDQDEKAADILKKSQDTRREKQAQIVPAITKALATAQTAAELSRSIKAELQGNVQTAQKFLDVLFSDVEEIVKRECPNALKDVQALRAKIFQTDFARDGRILQFPEKERIADIAVQLIGEVRKSCPNAFEEAKDTKGTKNGKFSIPLKIPLPLEGGGQDIQVNVLQGNRGKGVSKENLSFNIDDQTGALLLKFVNEYDQRVKKIASYLSKNVIPPSVSDQATVQSILTRKTPDKISDFGDALDKFHGIWEDCRALDRIVDSITNSIKADLQPGLAQLLKSLADPQADISDLYIRWVSLRSAFRMLPDSPEQKIVDIEKLITQGFDDLLQSDMQVRLAQDRATGQRRRLDHKKFMDMLIDDVEDKFIELVEGTRAHIANLDAYIKRLATALDDDFNTQFYEPAFRYARKVSRYKDVNLSQIETTSVLANNRSFAKASPQATMEFDLPKRDILITEAMRSAQAAYTDYGALLADPHFMALTKLYSGQPTSSIQGSKAPGSQMRDVLPGLPSSSNESLLNQPASNEAVFMSALEGLIPDPAVYKFETGTGFEIRPVIQPDGQSVVFHLNYMYTTNVREPVRADEKHLGRVKRHFVDTDVQLGNYELREVSRYRVALKASRTSGGVPLLENAPGVGALFRPLPQQESSLQENVILAQSTIFPTLFDLMGLRWAPAVVELEPHRLQELEHITRGRQRLLKNRVFDYSSGQVDEFLRIPEAQRRPDLYRSQEPIPSFGAGALAPNGPTVPMKEGGEPGSNGVEMLPGPPPLPMGTPEGAEGDPGAFFAPGAGDAVAGRDHVNSVPAEQTSRTAPKKRLTARMVPYTRPVTRPAESNSGPSGAPASGRGMPSRVLPAPPAASRLRSPGNQFVKAMAP